MAGGVNNLGTTLGPLVVSIAIFGIGATAETTLDIQAVKLPYLALGALFTLFGFIFWKSDFGGPATASADSEALVEAPAGTLGMTQVWMGMVAIFVYVGVEVSTASNLPAYLEKFQGVALHEIAPYVSLYWASLMIGRWTAASGAMGLRGPAREAMRWVMPLAAFAVFAAVNSAAGHDALAFLPYLAAIALLTLLDWSTKGNPARQLLYYSVAGAAALILGMNAEGPLAIYAFLSVGLFASTLWPCIFTLAITGLGGRTPQASNALIMMIMGGGVVSLLQGYLADDALLGLRQSFWVGVVCFAYLAFYAVTVSRVLKARGVDLDALASEGGH
jgi:FHS family L-fucose permease-like MFS transporter